MLKALVVIAAVALVMFVVGWLQFSSNESEATITIDKSKVKEDVKQAAAKVQEVTEELQERVEKSTTKDDAKSPLIQP